MNTYHKKTTPHPLTLTPSPPHYIKKIQEEARAAAAAQAAQAQGAEEGDWTTGVEADIEKLTMAALEDEEEEPKKGAGQVGVYIIILILL